ncbi:MAG: CapA family protein [Armatimonadota bacterium]|nr:CapA family protein [Armatimonadota bacterium]
MSPPAAGRPTWTLAAAGDVMLERPPAANPAHEWLRQATVAFANLEAPLTDLGYPADKLIVLRGAPALAPALRQMGLTVVSFAHNHALDFGIAGLRQTLEVVEAAGVRVIGAGQDLSGALAPAITARDGVRVAWVGFASTLPPGSSATPERPGVAPLRVRVRFEADASVMEEQPGTSPYVSTSVEPSDLDRAAAAVRDARRGADVVVVSIHWGVPPGWAAPFQGVLADYQQPLAHALVDAGADVLLGHHPHTLHGVEIYRGRPILYSLGNFVFHAMAEGRRFALGRPAPPYRMDAVRVPELDESAVFLLDFDGPRCVRVRVRPTASDRGGEQRPVIGSQASRILERMQSMCAAMGAGLAVSGDTGVIDIA